MTTKHNDEWFADLASAVKVLFDADKSTLDRLMDKFGGTIWGNFATQSLNDKNISYENTTTLIDKLKNKSTNYNDIQKLNFEDIKAKNSLLKGILIEVTSIQNGDKRLTYTLKRETGRENEAWTIMLIAYIQHKYGMQNDYEFAQEFIKLTKNLNVTTPQFKKTVISDTNIAVTTQEQQNMTLILVFGQSHKETINEIKDKKQLNESDFELLENKCEWFWFGLSKDKPSEIANDMQNYMCWLQLDINLPNIVQVKNLLHLKDLIKRIKKQPAILTQIKSNDSTFNLDNKVFTKA